MSPSNRIARTVGILYIIGTVAGILSVIATGPVRSTQGVLVAENETRLVVGALCVLTMGLALAMIPVIMFPTLRKHNEVLALGYVILRGGLEAVGYLATVISWLILAPLNQVYADVLDDANFQTLNNLLLEVSAIGAVLTVVFGLGALVFYSLLFQTKLVPRWLSGWGLIAIAPYIAAGGFLAMFNALEPLTPIHNIMHFPLALQEMVLAVWLIVKGFNSSAIAFLTGKKVA